MKYHFLTGAEIRPYQAALARFEAQFRYPLGDDGWFRISHGDDYGAFFRSLGRPRYILVEDGGEVVAFAAGCRRTFHRPGNRSQDLWYLCDFKIAKPYRGGRTFIGIGSRMLPRFYRFWIGAYFVGMNKRNLSDLLAEEELATSGIASLIPLRAFPSFTPVSLQAVFFAEPLATPVTGSAGEREILGGGGQAWRQVITEPLGSYTLTSNRGIKDILREPDLQPMALLHAGAFAPAPGIDRVTAALTLVQSARARAAALGCESLCFGWDARDAAVMAALQEAGLTTESSGTVYDLYPPGVRRIPLPIQTAEI